MLIQLEQEMHLLVPYYHKLLILEQPKVILKDEKMLVDFTKNANKVGALTTTKLGALDSIPSWDEITA